MDWDQKAFNVENCHFEFKCPRHWEDLDETDKPDKRHCWACDNEVFLVENKVMFEAHARLGHCVAVLDPSRKRKVYALGGPSLKEYGPSTELKWD